MIIDTTDDRTNTQAFDYKDCTILIVDDNPTNLGLMVDYLEECGITVLVSQDGESGVGRAIYAQPDLILLDVLMPGIDGFEACLRLKKSQETQHIPIIFMTALDSEQDKVKAFEVGAVDYVSKPIQQEELLARIKLHLKLNKLTNILAKKTQKLDEQNKFLQQEIEHRKTTELILQQTNQKLHQEIRDRQQAEEALKSLNQHLEDRVEERTVQLMKTNRKLQQEILEHQDSKEALRKSETIYRQMIETASEGIWIIDADNYITFANNKMSEMLGYSVAEIIGKTLFSFMDDEWATLINKRLSRQTYGIAEQYDCKLCRKTGHEIWVIISTQPISDAEGKSIGALGMLTDITERKNAEDKLKISLKEKEILLKEIHHRVKNNLLVVSSLLDFQSDYVDDPVIINMFQESQNRIHSMALIHEQLYKSGNLAQVDFAKYITDLIDNLSQSYNLNPQGIKFEHDLQPVLLNIETAQPCGLIANELITNSLKHAFPNGGNGSIYLSLHNDSNQEITLTIRDNGKGFPEDIDFRNTESLGLQLVCTLTQQLEGTIKLQKCSGTVFVLKFSELNYQQRF